MYHIILSLQNVTRQKQKRITVLNFEDEGGIVTARNCKIGQWSVMLSNISTLSILKHIRAVSDLCQTHLRR